MRLGREITFNSTNGTVRVGPEKWIWPDTYKDFAAEIYNFKARSDDVFVCTFPRSGTTWTQEMIWLICNDLNYESALNQSMRERFPYFEHHLWYGTREKIMKHSLSATKTYEEMVKILGPKYESLAESTSRRFIKTHLPIKLMPRNISEVGAKVVYVARNPKDVAVSFYYLMKAFSGLESDFVTFAHEFINDAVSGTPYWKHIFDGWSYRNDANVHFMFYEDLKKDLAGSLVGLANFLGKPLRDEDLPKLVSHLQFDSIKNNPSVNFEINLPRTDRNFIRRGQVGGNPEMTEEISATFDAWTKENLAGSDFKFPV